MLKIIKNPDKEFYDKITQKVRENNLYCPCMLQKSQDTLCMCKAFREQTTEGACHCGRYIKVNTDA